MTGRGPTARLVPLGLRVLHSAWTDRVPSPAYDALSPTQRERWVADHPDSYLAVTQGHHELEPPERAAAFAGGRAALDDLIARGAFGPLRPASYYVLRLVRQGRTHEAVVGGIPVADVASGGLRRHENVRTQRATHLRGHLAEVGAQSSPLQVAHHPDPIVRAALASVTATEPLVTVDGDDGLEQTVWAVGPEEAAAIGEQFRGVALYLIDGHHRTAAALAHRRRVGPGRADRVLAAVHDADGLDNRAFHRVLDLGPDAEAFLEQLAARHPVRVVDARGRADDPALVERADAELALHHRGRWFLVDVPFGATPRDLRSPAERLADLDPVRLERAIDPVLGTGRVRFRPGTEPVEALLAESDAEGTVLALMRPVAVPDLLAIADAGLVMPPKSTYFVPKARSGLFVRPVLDDRGVVPRSP